MSKIRTEDQPAPEHTRATEFHNKVEASAKAAQVHGEAIRHSYESAQNVVPDDAGDAENRDAHGTEIGAPAVGTVDAPKGATIEKTGSEPGGSEFGNNQPQSQSQNEQAGANHGLGKGKAS